MKDFNYIRTNEWIWFVVGVAITVLYVIFSTQFYELLYRGSSDFANEMYNNNMYLVVAIATTLVVWTIAALYYVFIDKFPRFISWFIFFIVAILCAPAVNFVYVNSEFQEMNLDFVMDLENFALVNVAVTAVLFFIVSLCIKGLSKNCATTPF